MNQRNIVALLFLLLFLPFAAVSADDGNKEFVVYNAANGLADNSAQTIKCTKTGRLVISTIGQINFYDGMAFSHIDPLQEDEYPLSNYEGHYHAYFDRHHHLWLKNKHTVTCVNLTIEHFIPDISAVFRELGADYEVNDLFVDDDGRVWLMHGDSLSCKESEYSFHVDTRYNLQDLATYKDQLLLLFYGNGEVVGFDMKNGQQLFRNAPYTGTDIEKYHRTSLLCPYKETYYQIRNGHKEGVLMCFDVAHREWRIVQRFPYKLNNIVIYENVAYIASEYGYWTYDIAADTFHHQEELTLANGHQLLTDVNTIEFDRQGGMWVGTEKRGLLYSKPFPSPFRTYEWNTPRTNELFNVLEQQPVQPTEFKGQSVNCVYTDSRGWTWVGTRVGLELYTSPEAQPKVFRRFDGLLNEVIHSVIEDEHHHIWASTSYGITCLKVTDDGKIEQILSYSETDNVPSESFVNGRAALLDDGTIVMQALDHIVTFNPHDFHFKEYSEFKLYPKLVRLVVNGISVEAGKEIDGKVVTDKAVTRTGVINVDYDQNSVSLTFSALNYFRPVQTYYRYRIVELSPEWKTASYYTDESVVDKDGMLNLRLVALSPGQYHIEVQASMTPGKWEDGYTWQLNVEEPWWRTSAVYLSLGLIILLLIIINMVFLNRNTRLRMRRNTGEKYVMKQLRDFVNRCDNSPAESPDDTAEESNHSKAAMELSEPFVKMMLSVVPMVRADKNNELNIRQLSEKSGVSVRQLYQLITQNINKNPRQLSQQLRLNEAARLLRETDKSVEQIAEESSFTSPDYFIVCFLRKFNMTPVEYRHSLT